MLESRVLAAFKFAETHGVAAESAYPYISGTGIRGLCKPAKENAAVVTVTGFHDVPSKVPTPWDPSHGQPMTSH